jgi:hypothetical protein
VRVTWIALLLAAFVVLLAAVWLGSLFYWANRHGPEQRALDRHMISTHALDRSERRDVQGAMSGGAPLDDPRLRAAVVDWSRRALERDLELRRNHPRGRVAVVVLYAVAALCLVAAVVPLVLDGRTAWNLRLSFAFDVAMVSTWAARPFLRRRNWQRAIDRNRDDEGRRTSPEGYATTW